MHTALTNPRRRPLPVLLATLAALLMFAVGASAQAPILRSVTSNAQAATLTVQTTTTLGIYYIYRSTTPGGEQLTQSSGR